MGQKFKIRNILWWLPFIGVYFIYYDELYARSNRFIIFYHVYHFVIIFTNLFIAYSL